MTFNLLGWIDIDAGATRNYPVVDRNGPILTEDDTNPNILNAPQVFIQRDGALLVESINGSAAFTITDSSLYLHFKTQPRTRSWSGLPEIANAAKRAAGHQPAIVLAGRLPLTHLLLLATKTSGMSASKLLIVFNDATVDPSVRIIVTLSLTRGKISLKSLDPRSVAADIHRRAMVAKRADPRFANVDSVQSVGDPNPFQPRGLKDESVGYRAPSIT